MLGFKGLAWKSVTIPAIMPKPDVLALTGGYRRTPFLQVGADVYCDTTLISRTLEDLAPAPTLYPYGDSLAVEAIQHLADGVLFNVAVPIAFQPAALNIFFPDADAAFFEKFRADRGAMRKGGTVRRGPLAECKANYAHFAERIETQLHGGRAFLLGSSPCVADFALYHVLWALDRVPATRALLAAQKKTAQWLQRMKAFGHGKPKELSSLKAIEEAKYSTPAKVAHAVATETDGIAIGEPCEVLPVDYALDAVAGELVSCSSDEIIVRRSDPRAGTVHVHFPRFGFQLRKPG